jgi:hypothetical protein
MEEEIELFRNQILMSAFNHPNQNALEAQPGAILLHHATGESFASMKRRMKDGGFVGRGSVDRFVDQVIVVELEQNAKEFQVEQAKIDSAVEALLMSVGDPLSDSGMS